MHLCLLELTDYSDSGDCASWSLKTEGFGKGYKEGFAVFGSQTIPYLYQSSKFFLHYISL